jgi:hypothetical protein
MGAGNAGTGTISELIAECLKNIFHEKTWASVEKLLWPGQERERLAKHRLAATRDFTVDELATLLRSEHGFTILSAIMTDARPGWWRLCMPLMQAADARKLQRQAQAKIARALKGALDADDDLSASIARAEAAFSVQDEEFMRPHLDGLRAQSGALHRAMASKTKGPRR